MKAKYTLTVEAIDDSGETMVRTIGSVTVDGARFPPGKSALENGALAAHAATLRTIAAASQMAAPRATVTVDGPNLDPLASRPS